MEIIKINTPFIKLQQLLEAEAYDEAEIINYEIIKLKYKHYTMTGEIL